MVEIRRLGPFEFFKRAHAESDVDNGPRALHHRLGWGAGQAAPGSYFKGSGIGGEEGSFTGVSKLGKTNLWVPTLTGSVSDPQLGSAANGMERRGWFSRVNDFCHGGAQFRFATSGLVFPAAAGSGNYLINLPLPIDTQHIRADATTGLSQPIGSCTIRDNSPVAVPAIGVVVAQSATSVRVVLDSNLGTLDSNSPVTWDVGDGFTINFAYPIAPGE